MANEKRKFKAACAFADSATGIHYAPGEAIDARTLKPSKDIDDRSDEMLKKGLIVDEDASLPGNPASDGTMIDRFEVRDGETVEDARKRLGMPAVAAVNVSAGAVAAQQAGKEGVPGPAQQDALKTEADGKKASGQ